MARSLPKRTAKGSRRRDTVHPGFDSGFGNQRRLCQDVAERLGLAEGAGAPEDDVESGTKRLPVAGTIQA